MNVGLFKDITMTFNHDSGSSPVANKEFAQKNLSLENVEAFAIQDGAIAEIGDETMHARVAKK